MQTETERKIRLALVQQMRPQVRIELEQALRLEIQTAFRDEIRKEVEANLVPDLEKRIAAELKAKQAKIHSAQKEQAEAAIQTQVAAAKKELEERMRKDAEIKVAHKLAKKVDAEVRTRVEKLRQELRTEYEAHAKSQIEAAQAQLKHERAEIARLRAAENVRRTREEAAHKEAQEEFHKKMAEFRRYVQEEEARLARMKAVTQWREEHSRREDHQKRPPSSLGNTPPPIPTSAPTPIPTSVPTTAPIPVSGPPSVSTNSPLPPTPIHPTSPSSVASIPAPPPALQGPTRSSNNPPSHVTAARASPEPYSHPQPHTRPKSPQPPPQSRPRSLSPPPAKTPSHPYVQPPNTHANAITTSIDEKTKPTGVAFDFTFDVKLIAAKLISDAREYTRGGDTGRTVATTSTVTTTSQDTLTEPNRATPLLPSSPLSTMSSSPSPSTPNSQSPSPTRYTLGQIASEQQAQREFEKQPPIVPPAGALGARLRVLLPRLYQLWDECEASHIHRRDFSNSLRSLDVAQAERRVAMEIARLRRVLPTIQHEMALVVRREAIKARLAQEDTLTQAEKASLQVELRRVTTTMQAAIRAWEAANGQPFIYRGFPYLALISPPTQ
jgi:hypothetical protein